MQTKVIVRHCALVSLALAVSLSQAAEPRPPAEKLDAGKSFMAVFVQTCVQGIGALDVLGASLDGKVKRLTSEQTKAYLPHGQTAAWQVNLKLGSYVIGIRDQEHCAVYSSHTDAGEAEKAFEVLIATTKKSGVTVTKEKDQRVGPPAANRGRIISYVVKEAGQQVQQMKISLVTTDMANLPYRAMASISLLEE